jgi:hypothetical protein
MGRVNEKQSCKDQGAISLLVTLHDAEFDREGGVETLRNWGC